MPIGLINLNLKKEVIMLPTKRNQNWLPAIINDIMGSDWMLKSSITSPALNIIESDSEFRIELAAPGIDKENFKVDINNDGQLVISMSKRETTGSEAKYLRRDFAFSQFQQTLILPDNVDKENIEATHTNGVLTVVLRKRETVDIAPVRSVNIQ